VSIDLVHADWVSPLAPYLDRAAGINDININAPGGYWILPAKSDKQYISDPRITNDWCRSLAAMVEKYTSQTLSHKHPLLDGHMPSGERIAIILPPIGSDIHISIRIPSKHVFSLSDFSYASEETPERLVEIVRDRQTLLISGGTGAGKTSLMSALLHYISAEERLITIENSLELNLPLDAHPDQLRLAYSRGDQVAVGSREIVRATLRFDPDRILLSEARGGESYHFLNAANTGHPGMTTVHAPTPAMALKRMATLAAEAVVNMTHEELMEYTKETIPFVVQVTHDPTTKARIVGDIYDVAASA